jgi:hypothetical protein
MRTLKRLLEKVPKPPRWRLELLLSSGLVDLPTIIMSQDRWHIAATSDGLIRLVEQFQRKYRQHDEEPSLGFLQHVQSKASHDRASWVAAIPQAEGSEGFVIPTDSLRPNDKVSFFLQSPVTGQVVSVDLVIRRGHLIQVRVPKSWIKEIENAWRQAQAL